MQVVVQLVVAVRIELGSVEPASILKVQPLAAPEGQIIGGLVALVGVAVKEGVLALLEQVDLTSFPAGL